MPILRIYCRGIYIIIITVLELSMDFPYTLPVSLHVQGKGIKYEDSINKTENAANCNENLL